METSKGGTVGQPVDHQALLASTLARGFEWWIYFSDVCTYVSRSRMCNQGQLYTCKLRLSCIYNCIKK